MNGFRGEWMNDFTPEEIPRAVKKSSNWKSPGLEKLHDFFD